MPLSALIAFGGMLTAVVGAGFLLVYTVVRDSWQPMNPVVGVIVFGGALLVLAAIPAFAAWAVPHGWRSAPFLVTLVGAFQFFQFARGADVYAILLSVVGIASVICIWLPSSTAFGAARREAVLRAESVFVPGPSAD